MLRFKHTIWLSPANPQPPTCTSFPVEDLPSSCDLTDKRQIPPPYLLFDVLRCFLPVWRLDLYIALDCADGGRLERKRNPNLWVGGMFIISEQSMTGVKSLRVYLHTNTHKETQYDAKVIQSFTYPWSKTIRRKTRNTYFHDVVTRTGHQREPEAMLCIRFAIIHGFHHPWETWKRSLVDPTPHPCTHRFLFVLGKQHHPDPSYWSSPRATY